MFFSTKYYRKIAEVFLSSNSTYVGSPVQLTNNQSLKTDQLLDFYLVLTIYKCSFNGKYVANIASYSIPFQTTTNYSACSISP